MKLKQRETGKTGVMRGWEFAQRFWNKVTKTETCWIWNACKDKAGYGRVGFPGAGKIHATHAAWFLKTGIMPVKGTVVMHTCDVPACVNPEHLCLGTQAANMKDMAAKGRAAKGENHWTRRMPGRIARGEKQSKLSRVDVLAIRELHRRGIPPKFLSSKFSVSKSQIHRIVQRQRWAHV